MPQLVHRPLSSLARTTLPWLSIRDHFVATVGPTSGRGKPLGPVLVMADATFAPRSRFPIHPHREVDILSVVVDGTMSHRGDQANGATVGPRSAQLISARTGIMHAEGNDADAPMRMLQIWFQPHTFGGKPEYFSRELSGHGRQILAGDSQMPLRADARVWWLDLGPHNVQRLSVAVSRQGYLLATTARTRVMSLLDEAVVELAVGEGLEVGPGTIDVSSDGGAVLWIDAG